MTPFDDINQAFLEMQREMNRYLDRFVRAKRPMAVFSHEAWRPQVNVCETSSSVVVLVELPGVRQDDLELNIQGESLTVRGHRKDPQQGDVLSCHLMEICFGGFERTVELPAPVNADAAEATLADGMLLVKLPKRASQPVTRVVIRAD